MIDNIRLNQSGVGPSVRYMRGEWYQLDFSAAREKLVTSTSHQLLLYALAHDLAAHYNQQMSHTKFYCLSELEGLALLVSRTSRGLGEPRLYLYL